MPTACGIETLSIVSPPLTTCKVVATVPTACGIETLVIKDLNARLFRRALQQCLPLAVLKRGN